MEDPPESIINAPSDVVCFKVKYRTSIRSFQIKKEMSMHKIVELVVGSFQESVKESKAFRLGLFAGDVLIRYISNADRFLLKHELVVLLPSPEVSSRQLSSLLACICECLRNPERLDEIENLSDKTEELLQYMGCDEFIEQFVISGGIQFLFRLIITINECTIMRTEIRIILWRQLLKGLTSLIDYDPLILESGRGVDIIDYPFKAHGFEWTQVSDEVIFQILNCHLFLDDPIAYRNCLLLLLSFLKSCPNRVNLLLENSIASFLYNVLEASQPRRRDPPVPQAQRKLSRSNSRQGVLTVRQRALSPSPSISANLVASASASNSLPAIIGTDQGKKRRKVSELHVLVVCLIYVIYEASADSLTEIMNVLPPYCIASVVSDLMINEDTLEKSLDAMISPQCEYRDDVTPSSVAAGNTAARSTNLFSTLKLPRGLLNSIAFSRISRMGSMVNDPSANQNLVTPPTAQLTSLYGQPPMLHVSTNRPPVDATPINDEKQNVMFTDPLEINLREMLINLQHLVISSNASLIKAPTNERQMHRVLRDLCRLILPDITNSSNSSDTSSTAQGNAKVEVYRMCGFSNPHKPDEDFKVPPRMFGVACLSALIKHRGELIRRILENQGAFEKYRQSRSEGRSQEFAPPPISLLAWLCAEEVIGSPVFPLLPAVRAVAMVLCEHFAIIDNAPMEDEQLITLFFQSSPNADSVLLELFLHCFDAFYNIWFALNADTGDLEIIAKALSTTVKNALSNCPNTFDEFARELASFSLTSVQHDWGMREEEREKNHPGVQELHRDLVRKHTETVTKERLYTMSHGPPLIYMKHTKKEVQRLHVSLSSDQNLLLARDSDNHIVEIWPLSSIVAVTSYTEPRKVKHRDWSVVLTISSEPPTEQEMDGMARQPLVKQQTRDNQIILNAPSENIQMSWLDGFSCLRKEKFTSAAFADDVNSLSKLELRVRLLGMNLDSVPTKPLEVPSTYPDLEGLTF